MLCLLVSPLQISKNLCDSWGEVGKVLRERNGVAVSLEKIKCLFWEMNWGFYGKSRWFIP